MGQNVLGQWLGEKPMPPAMLFKDCLGAVLRREIQVINEMTVGGGIVRFSFQGVPETRQRVIEPAMIFQGVGQVEVGCHIIRIEQ